MKETYEPLDFSDLGRTAVDVPIGDKIYILREASGDAAVKYRNAILRATKLSDGKVSGLDGLADAEPLLVSLCLFETLRDGEGRPTGERNVPIPTIRSWPNRVQKALFDRIKAVSNLDDRETKESLRKQLTEIKKKLDDLEISEREQGQETKDPLLPSPSSTMDG